MQIKETHIVPPQEKSIRIQEYGIHIFATITTRSALKKAIKAGSVLVNGNVSLTSTLLQGGETIQLLALEDCHSFKQFELSLSIHYEDEYLAVVEKPAGIVVSGNTFRSIDNALPFNLTKSNLPDVVRPRPVHRLDYPTTGLLLIGKTSSGISAMNKLFEQKDIYKTYHAITIGSMDTMGIIQSPVDGKEAISNYSVLHSISSDRFGTLNLVELSPKTGRRHQLRKHLSGIGNPILGDKEYGIDTLILKGKGLYLHASKLEFRHPFLEKTIRIDSKLPRKFIKIFPDVAF